MRKLMFLIATKPRFHKRRRFVPSGPPPVAPLAMLSATITELDRGTMTVSLAFDNDADDPIAPLQEGVAAAWTATLDGAQYSGGDIVITSATTLSLTLTDDGVSGPQDGISYDPQEPASIETENGRVLPAMANVPFEQ